jgi:sugar O-acyltransferase (sialic acid O-acetyltransferase NeuD family)
MSASLHITNQETVPLVLVGGGGHSLIVAESAIASGWAIAGFLDDDADAPLGRNPNQALRIGPLNDLSRIGDRNWIIATGSLPFRSKLVDQLAQLELAKGLRSVIHPSAIVSPTARIGRGVFIGPGAIVNARAHILDHAIINSGAIVEHECTVGFNTHIAPGAAIAGRVRVGSHTLIGLGARVLPNLSIGDHCTIGAGSVVIRSVVDDMTLVGVPARAKA